MRIMRGARIRITIFETQPVTLQQREAAMRAVVAIRKPRSNEPNAIKEVRALRRGNRMDHLRRG
jgi:hypothetical protein